ncbi:hypothetical protein BC835DRAFT_1389926 [Cytidiella melzeri]|nr:hypothetical protein BC835DRAFT_1389926 [Cytidiella melzeri]
MLALLAAIAFLAAGIVANPVKRDGLWCEPWGSTGFDVASNFTLVAFDATHVVTSSSVGVPLVLGQAGATTGAEFHVLSTYASYPYGDPNQAWTLDEGVLLPTNQSVKIAGEPVSAGGQPTWVSSTEAGDSAQIWCGVAQSSAHGGGTGNPTLSVNGEIDQFSLCSTGETELAQVNIVYRASPDSYGYIYDTCSKVTVQMVGTY